MTIAIFVGSLLGTMAIGMPIAYALLLSAGPQWAQRSVFVPSPRWLTADGRSDAKPRRSAAGEESVTDVL